MLIADDGRAASFNIHRKRDLQAAMMCMHTSANNQN
jgi:hypothetical protein